MSSWMKKQTNRFKRLFRGGLQGKVFRLCLVVIAAAICLFVVIDMIQLQLLWKTERENSAAQAEAIREQSSDSLEKSTEANLTQTAIQAADNTDWELNILRHDTAVLAEQTEKILREPWRYSEYDISPPKKENGGKYTLQFLTSDDADVSDEDLKLARRLAGLGHLMEAMIADNEYHTQDMAINLPNGITLLMDSCSDQKFDDNGNVVSLDAKERPWWKGAVETGDIYFAPVNFSATNKTAEFEIGIPIYIDGELAAVVEAAMQLETLQEIVSKVTYGENGFSVIVSGDGQVIYSPRKEGDLKMDGVYSTDIRNSGNKELTGIVETALKGETGYTQVKIDGEDYYVAYAPMDTVNWTEMMFVSKNELEAPTNALLRRMDETAQAAFSHYQSNYMFILLVSSLLMFILVWATAVLARTMSLRLTGPINHMIATLGNITKESFSFEMEDTYRTGDEIEVLAETFDELSERTRRYIQEITEITAEKERIGVELDVATRIQEDMLPNDSPAFPDMDEFELYASMTPAREVGGDFYNFFLVDDDHLALAAMEGISFREHEFRLDPGDYLFVYTDGVPEATNKNGKLFGTERMVQALNEKEDAAPDELLPHVKTRVDEFVGDAPQFDDLTMLGIKWLGKTGIN